MNFIFTKNHLYLSSMKRGMKMNSNWYPNFDPRGRGFYQAQLPMQQGPIPQTRQTIVAVKYGDVTGDRVDDTVFLTATKSEDSPFLKNITLHIRNGRTNQIQTFQLTENAGYDPTLWLGDFTGNGVNDILIQIQSGGSGGIIYAYIFANQNGMKQIFDSIKFNEQHQYKVEYANYFKANVISENPHKRYTLDLTYKGQEYLNEIYNLNGTLKQPIEGWVDPVSGIYPIQIAQNGRYYLLTNQLIAGRYHADGLGYVENLLLYNGNEFNVVRQTVCIYGENL